MSKRPVPHHRADKTRERIVAAAQKLFIKHGFKLVSLEKIAKAAGCNHSLIYHHFGDKASLWQAVKMRIAKKAQASEALFPSLALPWSEFLMQLIAQQITFYKKNHEIRQLLIYQRIENKKPSKKVSDMSDSSRQWVEAITHYQSSGDINQCYSPAYVSCFILSVVSSLVYDHQPIIPDPQAELTYIEMCYQVILNGLA